jgi:hypothetical protein
MQITHQQSAHIYTHLPQQEWCRQLLIFPAINSSYDGIALYRNISNYVLWIELASHKVWGITIWTFTPFIPFRVLERIARRLETSSPHEFDSMAKSLSTLAGWRKAELTTLQNINTVAEDLARAEIRSTVENSQSLKLSDENVRKEAQPYKAELVEGLLKFNGSLDLDVLALIGNKPLLSMGDASAYNYLMHPVSKIECYRRQAMQTFPLLRDAFCQISSDFRFQRLQQNVDSGNPLLPVLTDYFRCSLRVVRYLVGKEFSLVGEVWRPQLDQLVDLLGMLKPDYWPQTSDDWQHFNQYMPPILIELGNVSERKYPEMLPACLNDLAKEGYSRIPARLERHGVTLIDIITIPDFERTLQEWAVEVGSTGSEARKALWNYSAIKVAVLSHRWHDWLLHRMEDEVSTLNKDEATIAGWPTLISSPWHNDQHTVVPLNYPWALHEEGQRMKHCVGTYVSQCRYFGAHIFSIRDSFSGLSLSTFEMHIGERYGYEATFAVDQHRAHGNARPSDACEQTLQKFLRHLRTTVTKELLHEIDKQLHMRQSESEKYRRLMQRRTWPRRIVEEFSKLLCGYPLLENMGQNLY